jgi:hypothetical protein
LLIPKAYLALVNRQALAGAPFVSPKYAREIREEAKERMAELMRPWL